MFYTLLLLLNLVFPFLLLVLLFLLVHHYLFECFTVLHEGEGAIGENSSLLHDDDAVRALQVLHRMGWHYYGLAPQVAEDGLLDKELPHMHIHRTQHVIQQINVFIGVDCPGQADPGFLPAREIDAFLTNFRINAIGEEFDIIFQARIVDGLLEFVLLEGTEEQNVLPDCARHDPGLLGGISNCAIYVDEGVPHRLRSHLI